MLCQPLSIISKPSVNSNWSYSLQMLNSDKNWQSFVLCDLGIGWMTWKNNRVPFLCYFKLCASFRGHPLIQIRATVRKPSIWVENRWFFVPYDLEIWRMTFKNNMAPLLCHFKLCGSFQSHQSIQTGVTVRKRPIRVKIRNFWFCVILKLNGWPWILIGHLFSATSSFVHHFTTIGDFKLQLQSRNAQFGSKSLIFGPTWPWNLMDDLKKP